MRPASVKCGCQDWLDHLSLTSLHRAIRWLAGIHVVRDHAPVAYARFDLLETPQHLIGLVQRFLVRLRSAAHPISSANSLPPLFLVTLLMPSRLDGSSPNRPASLWNFSSAVCMIPTSGTCCWYPFDVTKV